MKALSLGNLSQTERQTQLNNTDHIVGTSTPRDNHVMLLKDQVLREIEETGRQKEDVPGDDESGVIFITAGTVSHTTKTHSSIHHHCV